jgi:drug/metabolite transporter (DMT)-like permease
MCCWGFSWASGKVISGYGEPTTIALIRFMVTFFSLLLILVFRKESFKIERKGLIYLFISASLMSVYSYFFLTGLLHGKAGAGGVLLTTINPIISYGIAILISRKIPAKNEAIGLAIGFVACLVLLNIWTDWHGIFRPGNLYFIFAAFLWSVLSFFTSKSAQFGSPIVFSMWMFALCSILTSFAVDKYDIVHVINVGDTVFWANMFFSGTVTTAFATTFFFVATTKLGASKASSYLFLVPFTAALGSWIFLEETPQINTIIGGVMGIVAVYMLNKK